MTGITKGPWHIDGRMIATPAACIALMCNFDSFGGMYEAPNAKANARAIAQVPEMVVLCNWLANGDAHKPNDFQSPAQMARAILRKMEGE